MAEYRTTFGSGLPVAAKLPDASVSAEITKEALQRALCRRVGTGRGISVSQAADALGMSERALRDAMAGRSMPLLHNAWSMCRLFGPTFASEIGAPAGLVIADAADTEAAKKLQRAFGAADALRAVAMITGGD